MEPISIDLLEPEHANLASAVCAAAFQNYGWVRLVPGDERRTVLLNELFAAAFRHATRNRAAWGAIDRSTGAIIGSAYAYIDAGDGLPDLPELQRVLRAHLNEHELDLLNRVFEAMSGVNANAAPLPVRHLELLGVDPAHQGRGVGGHLLRHIQQIAQQDGMPLRLDTHEPANVDFYEYYGFNVTGHAADRATETEVWSMVWTASVPDRKR